MAHNRSFIIAASALFAIVYQSAFAIPAEAAITFSFSNLALTSEPNGYHPEVEPDFFVSGSLTVSALFDTPADLDPVPLHPVDSVSLTISLTGAVIRSFNDPTYFSYSSYVGLDGTSYL